MFVVHCIFFVIIEIGASFPCYHFVFKSVKLGQFHSTEFQHFPTRKAILRTYQKLVEVSTLAKHSFFSAELAPNITRECVALKGGKKHMKVVILCFISTVGSLTCLFFQLLVLKEEFFQSVLACTPSYNIFACFAVSVDSSVINTYITSFVAFCENNFESLFARPLVRL